MRRILAGIVSAAVGAVVYLVLLPRFGNSDPTLYAVAAAVLGTYGAIDWIGVLPGPFRRNPVSILHDPDHRDA